MVKHVRWLAVLSALSVATPAWAQVQTGTILVKAVDDQGAVVPGAAWRRLLISRRRSPP